DSSPDNHAVVDAADRASLVTNGYTHVRTYRRKQNASTNGQTNPNAANRSKRWKAADDSHQTSHGRYRHRDYGTFQGRHGDL
ncbi:hypothetical protein M514_22830, partial [Trichuris suis]